MEIETQLNYTFEVQLSSRHEKVNSIGRWGTAEEAAYRAGMFLVKAIENGFTNASVKVTDIEEYNLLD